MEEMFHLFLSDAFPGAKMAGLVVKLSWTAFLVKSPLPSASGRLCYEIFLYLFWKQRALPDRERKQAEFLNEGLQEKIFLFLILSVQTHRSLIGNYAEALVGISWLKKNILIKNLHSCKKEAVIMQQLPGDLEALSQ